MLSELKARKLATALSAWFEESTYAGEFHIKIDLSEEGMKQYKKVVQLFYIYIDMLKKSGYPEYIYREMKVMGEIEYVHREHMEGSDFASYLASKMHLYPALEVERRSFLMYKEDKQSFDKFLSFIDSNNFLQDKIDKSFFLLIVKFFVISCILAVTLATWINFSV